MDAHCVFLRQLRHRRLGKTNANHQPTKADFPHTEPTAGVQQFTDFRCIGEYLNSIQDGTGAAGFKAPQRGLIGFVEIIAGVVAPRSRRRPSPNFTTTLLRHLGGFGLLLIAVVDSSPLPTFGGTDILTAILAARHAEPWYYYVAMATVGSVIGAYITFHAAQKAGSDYLQRKFGKRRFANFLETFERWGTGGLAVSTAVPFPFPTSALFAAAGVLKYPTRRFLFVVTACRGARYAVIGLVAFYYGRHFIRVLRHPGQYYGWFIGMMVAVAALVATAILVHRHSQPADLARSPQ